MPKTTMKGGDVDMSLSQTKDHTTANISGTMGLIAKQTTRLCLPALSLAILFFGSPLNYNRGLSHPVNQHAGNMKTVDIA